MGEASERIERHIRDEREKLDQDLHLIESKVRLEAERLRSSSAVRAGILVAAGIVASLLLVRLVRA